MEGALNTDILLITNIVYSNLALVLNSSKITFYHAVLENSILGIILFQPKILL